MKKLVMHDDDGYSREYWIPDKARVKISTTIPAKITIYHEQANMEPVSGPVNTKTWGSDSSDLRGTWRINRPETVVGVDLNPVRIWKTGSSQVEPW